MTEGILEDINEFAAPSAGSPSCKYFVEITVDKSVVTFLGTKVGTISGEGINLNSDVTLFYYEPTDAMTDITFSASSDTTSANVGDTGLTVPMLGYTTVPATPSPAPTLVWTAWETTSTVTSLYD